MRDSRHGGGGGGGGGGGEWVIKEKHNMVQIA